MVVLRDLTPEALSQHLRERFAEEDGQVAETVALILEDVRKRGDAALLDSARRFDAPGLDSLLVTSEEMEGAMVSPSEESAIRETAGRVRSFHKGQLAALTQGWLSLPDGRRWSTAEPTFREPGLGQRLKAVRSAGIYVPGGRAAYPSSVLMNAVPAAVAGVREILVCTPARSDGSLPPAVLAALGVAGVEVAVKVGGAAAIAAMAFGTESVPRADVIAGPGNRYVNEAKRQVWGKVGLDGFAGPSEVCVLADGSTNARYAATDLLTQIEHAPDNLAYLVCIDEANAAEIGAEAESMIGRSPRKEILAEAWKHALSILASGLDHAVDLVNAIAPEHLSVAIERPERILDRLESAGCVLLGEFTPESAGDFAAGPSHTLPTATAARYGSPVNVLTFMKLQSLIRLDQKGLGDLRKTIETFGEMEGFPMHGYGATVRFE